ncbi:MAG: SDR family oxidoreductase, partial [Gemmatimonadetes bacterium]|nr:SDR family oxidoreductase [Gemmatimonadota bacterium]NIQ60294.1 SDR family oxidoreductase [Gemmatimonadota bacterium]NIU80512.1 SDR family oxidoreductase [Gammaproteobacteria bacterium]NIX48837.1 SDR family oxidoreductase [Gemmatimonadota bacterium]NIY13286.1 SDR family oxidoreductase [Gemmatimonadota bacterium]
RSLAEAFAGAGARLVVCARGEAELGAAVAALEARGAEVEWGAVDVADEAAVAALVARSLERFGAITVLVNNAAILGPRIPLREYPVDVWRQVLEVNLTGTLIATQAVLPAMRAAGRGSIITLSSTVGVEARRDWGAYAISKWGVEALTRNLALEEEDAGIRVNVVDPGRLRTEMRRAAYPEEDPDRPAPPEDAVDVFLWLASEDSAGVTGERFRALEWP